MGKKKHSINIGAVKALSIQNLEAITLAAAKSSRFKFIEVGIITVDYKARREESKLDGSRNDYYAIPERYSRAFMNETIPEGATHYLIGPKRTISVVLAETDKPAIYQDIFPILFFKSV